MRTVHTISVPNLKRRDHFREIIVDGRLTVKCILKGSGLYSCILGYAPVTIVMNLWVP
jgi:hypothetical protein